MEGGSEYFAYDSSFWNVPISQCVPSYPAEQLQEKEFTWSMQEAPFWQGVEEHSSTSGGCKKNKKWEKKNITIWTLL